MPREKTNGQNKKGPRRRSDKSYKDKVFNKDLWNPKTKLGQKVKSGEISSLKDALRYGKIMESEIVDCILPEIKHKIVDIKKTTRVTRAGRHFSFRVTAIVGDSNGHIGIGSAKDIERFNAQEKAIQKAKLNMVVVKRGSGSWESNTYDDNSVPYRIVGKCASLRVELLPAPKGVGLAVSDSIKPVLELAGITNVWSKTRGATDTKLNFVKATIDALHNLSKLKTLPEKKEEE
ncbi:30S ribosomal protein S5 [archaeon]|nr:30S ribosomal protein S5 [archaeon]NCP79569.1 30S ribosomal protein S5 [archaeon]NCP97513.1 30S ribosomal protein S5 [archaeon]NCQ07336.1 30S ribosomal protein S5 [archaeon]NCQ51132.1 30S ribosomal protein S5 [archaeon]